MDTEKNKDDINLEEAAQAAEDIAEEAAQAAAEAAAVETAEEAKDAEGEDADASAGKKDPKDAKIAELQDKLVRQMAEFDNYRKRTDREKAEMFDMGVKSILEKLLPTVDNFERGLAAAEKADAESGAKAIAEGMQMIYKGLMATLENAGVTPIECEGKEFDPNFHNAVMHEEDDSEEQNIVSMELQKGYMYKNSVLRHSMVKVKN